MRIALDARSNLRIALVLGLLALAVNAGFYLIVIRPRVRAYEDLEGARTSFDRELGSAEKRQKAIASYYEGLTETQANTEKFFKEILGTKQEKMIEIQREIAEIADQFGIDPQTLSMQNDEKEEDGLERFGIEIPIEGDYTNLRKFLARLENSKTFLIVDRISLTLTKEGGLNLQFLINVSTYFNAPWLKGPKATSRPGRKRA